MEHRLTGNQLLGVLTDVLGAVPVGICAWQVLLDGLLHTSESGRACGVGQGVLVSPWDGLLHVVLLRQKTYMLHHYRPCQLSRQVNKICLNPALRTRVASSRVEKSQTLSLASTQTNRK